MSKTQSLLLRRHWIFTSPAADIADLCCSEEQPSAEEFTESNANTSILVPAVRSGSIWLSWRNHRILLKSVRFCRFFGGCTAPLQQKLATCLIFLQFDSQDCPYIVITNIFGRGMHSKCFCSKLNLWHPTLKISTCCVGPSEAKKYC